MNSVVIKADNKKAIELSRNSEFHICMKYIDIQYHLSARLLNDISLILNIFLQLIKSLTVSLNLYLL